MNEENFSQNQDQNVHNTEKCCMPKKCKFISIAFIAAAIGLIIWLI